MAQVRGPLPQAGSSEAMVGARYAPLLQHEAPPPETLSGEAASSSVLGPVPLPPPAARLTLESDAG